MILKDEFEFRLLKAFCKFPDAWKRGRQVLKRHYFNSVHAQYLFETMADLEVFDMAVLQAAIPEENQGLLALLSDVGPLSETSVDGIVHQIVYRNQAKTLSQTLQNLSEACRDGKFKIPVIKKLCLDALTEAENSPSANYGLMPIRDFMEEMLQKVKDTYAGKIQLEKTGLSFIDNVLGGMLKTDLVVIGARPSIGKTSLGLQIATNRAREGRYIAYFSMEMLKGDITLRDVFARSGILYSDFQKAIMPTETQWKSLEVNTHNLPKDYLYVCDKGAADIGYINDEISRLKSDDKCDMVIVDHFHIMGHGKDMREGMTKTSKGLKKLAVDYHIPVVALAQLNRGSANDERFPRSSDLRECGSIEEDADRVILPHRPFRLEGKWAEHGIDPAFLICDKNRNGPTRTIKCWFDQRKMAFESDHIFENPFPGENPWEAPKKSRGSDSGF